MFIFSRLAIKTYENTSKFDYSRRQCSIISIHLKMMYRDSEPQLQEDENVNHVPFQRGPCSDVRIWRL